MKKSVFHLINPVICSLSNIKIIYFHTAFFDIAIYVLHRIFLIIIRNNPEFYSSIRYIRIYITHKYNNLILMLTRILYCTILKITPDSLILIMDTSFTITIFQIFFYNSTTLNLGRCLIK